MSSEPRSYRLERFPEKIAVVQLGPGAEVPDWAESSSLFSITATALETSLVCAARNVPKKAKQAGPFTAFAVQGPLDFSMVGVLARLLQPLADAEISVLTISTFDTDWILVPVNAAEQAAETWRTAGHEVVVATPVPPERTGAAKSAEKTANKPAPKSGTKPRTKPRESNDR